MNLIFKFLSVYLVFNLSCLKADAQQILKNTVLVFYSSTCPVCLKSLKTIKELNEKYASKGITFQLIFPALLDTEKRIKKFKKQNAVSLAAAVDHDKKLTNLVKATITPQAFLIDSNTKVVYSGKIDNSFESISKRRTIITEFYLENALENYLNGTKILLKTTEPVGCLIN